jgi:hypothetical protein
MAINTTYALTQDNTQGTPAKAYGKVVFGAAAITAADYIDLELGFTPKYVAFENVTDRIKVEHHDGMTADTCVKTAANGARTLETTNKGIILTERGFQVSQNATLAVIAASKTCYFVAYA